MNGKTHRLSMRDLYKNEPPHELEEIEKDIVGLEKIMEMLKEVTL